MYEMNVVNYLLGSLPFFPKSVDGVETATVTDDQLLTYKKAEDELNKFAVPRLYDSSDSNARVFVALFDGTANDAARDQEHITNVGLLAIQLSEIARSNPSVGSFYKDGPGNQGGVLGILDCATGISYSERIEEMYMMFCRQAAIWLGDNPGATLTVISVGFSRGAEQAVGFSRLVDERGLVGCRFYGNAGSVPQAIGLFDPVASGEPKYHDRRPPSSVLSGLQINAGNEHRALFPSTSIIKQGVSRDNRFLGVTTSGAHSDIGGGYRLNALSRRNFNLMRKYLNALVGEPLFTQLGVPANRSLNVIHESTQHKWFYVRVRQRQSLLKLHPDGIDVESVSWALAASHMRNMVAIKSTEMELTF